jgi:alkanesulfonate monooxygenase SsuD/methylene tetrahydromethanopterin reductase-like flavin-dependent oxidoreductase (luciferase family)
LKLGVITFQNAPWAELVERWQRLEELGVETIWVADHLGGPWSKGAPWFEAWSCIPALAYETRAPRIGPLVSPMTFRNPAVLARTALTVAELSGGRLELGIGSGASATDHELTQVPRWEPKERAAAFAAWVERLVELFADDYLHPKRDIPLTIVGRGPTILRLAAQYADRWKGARRVLPAGVGDAGGLRNTGRLRAGCLEGVSPAASKSRAWRARSGPPSYVRARPPASGRRRASRPAGTTIRS